MLSLFLLHNSKYLTFTQGNKQFKMFILECPVLFVNLTNYYSSFKASFKCILPQNLQEKAIASSSVFSKDVIFIL